MKKPEGIVDVKKNTFSTRSWIEQSHALTSHREEQLNSLSYRVLRRWGSPKGSSFENQGLTTNKTEKEVYMKKITLKFILIILFVFLANLSYSQDYGQDFYNSVKVLSELPQSEQEAYLKSVRDETPKGLIPDRPWNHSEHQIGFIPPRTSTSTITADIKPAHAINSDTDIKKINIRLDRLRVFDYPGWGTDKNVQLTFQAINDIKKGDDEQVAFTQAYNIKEGQGAGVTGYPIFIGLNVPNTGVNLRVVTLNLRSDQQLSALGVMDSSAFKSGLSLLETSQPAIAPFTTIALGAAKMLIESGTAKEIQKFHLGLDYDDNATTGVRLKNGSYVVVQAPLEDFRFSDYEFNYEIGRVTKKNIPDSDIPFNYIIFRISQK